MSIIPAPFESNQASWQASSRERIRALLNEKQARFAELDEQILERAEEAAEALRQQIAQQFELQSRREVAQRQETLLAQLLDQVQGLHAEFHQPREAVRDVSASPELIAEIHLIEDRRRELDLKESELHRLQATLDHRERETELQRKNISRQLWARKAELLAEVERLRADVAVVNSGQELQSQVRLAEELTRTERMQAELRRVEQQCDDARKLITDLRADLERERLLALEHDGRRCELEDERVQLSAELERLRTVSESATLEKAKLGEELRRSREETERKVADLRADQGRAFDEHLHQLFAQIDALTADRQQQQEELRELREMLRGEERITLNLRDELSRKESELASLSEASENQRRSHVEERTQWERQIEELRSEVKLGTAGEAELADSLRQEIAELRQQRMELELQLEEAFKVRNEANSQADEDLHARLQMALEEVREMRAKNQELIAELAKKPRPESAADSGGGYNWEEQKRRLLEQLESDFDDSNPQEKTDKLTVAGAIRITDQIVAEKEREIEELQKLLENQSNNIGDMAVGAAGISQLLESDELIMQERKHLQEVKEELQAKLRAAEIEISVERAKLGRERQDLEERLRTIEHERAKSGVIENGNGVPVGKPNRGAWLTRLGLKDKEN